MRTHFLSFFSLTAAGAFSQCSFVPTISPEQVILCPDGEQQLSTETYDSYQWFREGNPIPGATAQTYMATSANDGGYTITVEGTLAGCTAASAGLFVDGWVFLLPYVINEGDEPHSIDNNGVSHFCVGDTLLLELGQPYSENITWTNNGSPIPGEHGTILTVTETGLYSVSGAPDVCPNYVLPLGMDIGAEFAPNWQPEIVPLDNQLCPYPTGNTTQWYLNGEPLSTETCVDGAAPGVYTVFVDYGEECQVISEPFAITGVVENKVPAFTVQPVPASDAVRIAWPSGLAPQGNWQLFDMTGRTVRAGTFTGVDAINVDVRSLAPGKYWFAATGDKAWKPVPLAVVR